LRPPSGADGAIARRPPRRSARARGRFSGICVAAERAHYACAVSLQARAVRLIVNPAAGGGRARRLAPQAESALREHGLTVKRDDTRDLEHARELAVQAAQGGEVVAVLSGDGAVGAVADALRSVPGAVLGVLPGGRGNYLARVLGISDEIVAACATIAEGVPRAMDVGEVLDSQERGRSFVGIASAGFDSDANRIANEAPAWLGAMVYAYGALRASASASAPTRSARATPRPTAAACSRLRTRCSTTACSR
jgi:diacylglycerol kinase family enzyme